MGLIGLSHAWPPPKELGVQVTRNHPHRNVPKSSDLVICRHPLHQTKVEAHPMLNPLHLHRPLHTVSAILPHRQRTKESPEANTTNTNMPVLRKRRKGRLATNMADITMNKQDITDPEPHHHPALALRTTTPITRAHAMSMVGYQPHTLSPLKNS